MTCLQCHPTDLAGIFSLPIRCTASDRYIFRLFRYMAGSSGHGIAARLPVSSTSASDGAQSQTDPFPNRRYRHHTISQAKLKCVPSEPTKPAEIGMKRLMSYQKCVLYVSFINCYFSVLDKLLKTNNIAETNFRRQPFEGQRAYVVQNKYFMLVNEKAS